MKTDNGKFKFKDGVLKQSWFITLCAWLVFGKIVREGSKLIYWNCNNKVGDTY